jgi:RimJ/RimL family protein N-acetyltransferase
MSEGRYIDEGDDPHWGRLYVPCPGQMVETGQIVELRNGTKALIRPIRPEDRERLKEGFESASEESRFLRFLAPLPRLSSSQLDYLTSVDHVRHEALIAVDPETGQSFGTARYVRSDDSPETAEFAVGVGDQWMRIGLGTALLSALALRAREAGITRVTGVVHEENKAIRRLVASVLGPYETRTTEWGAKEIVAELPPDPTRETRAGT